MENKLILDLNRTLARMIMKHNNISWTRLSDFGGCPASCFIKHYAVFSEGVPIIQDFTKALAGLILQKILEVFINQRIYLRPEMERMEDLIRWCQIQFRKLYDAMAFDLEYQHRAEFKIKGGYYSGKKGQSVLANHHLRGLDIAFNKIEPCFVNKENLFLFYSSEENFLDKHERLMGPILESFVKEKINLNQVISEQKIEYTIGGNITLLGYVDFIFNKYGPEWEIFDKIGKLRSNYVLLDGKYKVASYTDKEQLFFYAAIIYMKYKYIPEWVAFIDWNKAEYIKHVFDPKYIEMIQYKVYAYFKIIGKIHKHLEQIKLKFNNNYMILEDLDNLDYIPSQGNCLFCPVRTCCKSAIEGGCTGIPKGVLRKAATLEYINGLELNQDKNVHDITF